MNIVLIGFMCSGKSRVGRALASRRGWPHLDTDELVMKKAGVSIADLIRTKGEPEFRLLERQTVKEIASLDNHVISTGGGVPLNPANMRDLSGNGKLVWLKVRPETVLRRAGNIASRPLIDPANPLASIKQKLKDRLPAYSQASYSLDTDELTADQVADQINRKLGDLPS
jgi:shikimate kinase